MFCSFQDLSNVAKNVMIYFDNSVDSFKNPIQPCTSVDECLDICESHPEACEAPIDVTRIQSDGVWSRERQNNPFAEYFKVMQNDLIMIQWLAFENKQSLFYVLNWCFSRYPNRY